MYGTSASSKEKLVSELGARPIDYKSVDFVQEIFRLTGNGVDVVFDGLGTKSLMRSYKTLRDRWQIHRLWVRFNGRKTDVAEDDLE